MDTPRLIKRIWNNQDARYLILIFIISIIAILIADIFNYGERIWDYFQHHTGELAQFLFDGVIAGLIATRIHSRFYERNIISEIQALPKELFSGDLVMQLFDYHPKTSSGLAKIIADLTSEWYMRNYDRVLVDYAGDFYKLRGLSKVEKADLKEDNDMEVWVLDFRSEWKWINDSQVTKKPLKDLIIILTTTDYAINNYRTFLTAETEPKRAEQRATFFELTKRYNIVRTQLVHVNNENPLEREAVNKMWNITKIWGSIIGKKGNKETVKEWNIEDPIIKEIERIDDAELPCGVYAAYKITGPNANLPLNSGEAMSVNLQGNILLPMDMADSKKLGLIDFRPSDIIKRCYMLSFIYPNTRKIHGLENGVIISQSISTRAYESTNQKKVCTELHNDFGIEDGEVEHQINVDGPLTDLNYITLGWRERDKDE